MAERPASKRERRVCASCGAEVAAADSFCTVCGRPVRPDPDRARARRERESDVRTVASLAVGFAGTLLALVIVHAALGHEPEEGSVTWLRNILFLFVAATAALVLEGPSAIRESVARLGAARWIALGVPAGAAVFALAVGYVWTIRSLLGLGEPEASEGSLAFEILDTAVLPALVEEWLCRGVLWMACRRAAGETGTILTTALLFSLLHGLGGGGFLEFPHRFVAGLVFGWMRARSGSLAPGIMAHFVNNLLAVLLD